MILKDKHVDDPVCCLRYISAIEFHRRDLEAQGLFISSLLLCRQYIQLKKRERHDGDADDILQKRKRDYFNLIRMKILFSLNEIKQSSFPQDPGRTGETLVSFKGCYFSTFF